MIDILLVMVAVFFLPGFFLVNALYPRKGELDKDYDALYRLTLGIVMSVVIVIIMGFILNTFGTDPDTGKGYFRAEIIWPILIFLAIFFFVAGWFRGAYPILGKLHPSLLRFPRREPQSVIVDLKEEKETVLAFRELSEEREKLRRQIKDYERRSKRQTGDMRKRSERKIMKIQEDLKKLDEQLSMMEEKRAAELY
jgi:hypothetical protein